MLCGQGYSTASLHTACLPCEVHIHSISLGGQPCSIVCCPWPTAASSSSMWTPLGQPVLDPLQALGERDASLLRRDAALRQRDATVRALEERALAAEAEVWALQASLRAERAAAAHRLGSAASVQRWALRCMRVSGHCSVPACRGRPRIAWDRLLSGCMFRTMRCWSGAACRRGKAMILQRWALLRSRLFECCRCTEWGPGRCLQPEAAAEAECRGGGGDSRCCASAAENMATGQDYHVMWSSLSRQS